MEASANLEAAPDASANFRPAGRWPRNARKDLQQRGLPGAVAPDQPENLPLEDFERDILKGPEGFLLRAAQRGERGTCEVRQGVTQRIVASSAQSASVMLSQPF